jgi:DNA-binding transcriptional MerR regulator
MKRNFEDAGERLLSGKEQAEGLLADAELAEIERTWPSGLTSRQIVDVFETRGIRFSEATLRKYVQLGLLPRSVRVGRKGKHRGSCGIYPSNVVRRVNLVKGMMSENLTIEQIRKSFAHFKEEIDAVEAGLRGLLVRFEREAREPALSQERRQALEREIGEAKHAADALVGRITTLEAQLTARAGQTPGRSGEGNDLY